MIESIDREISARKQMEDELRESEERYRRLFETSKDGILLLDRQTGNIININPAIVELFGDDSEFLGKNLTDIGLFKEIVDAQEIIQKLEEVGFIFYDYVPIKTKDGKSIDTEIYLIDRAKVIQCNIRNITERKKAEMEIKKRVKELEEFYDMAVGRELRVKELQETIEEMKEEIESLKEKLEEYRKQ